MTTGGWQCACSPGTEEVHIRVSKAYWENFKHMVESWTGQQDQIAAAEFGSRRLKSLTGELCEIEGELAEAAERVTLNAVVT